MKDIELLIASDDIASYGYYVGGMKMSDLDISATKQIILAIIFDIDLALIAK